MVLLAFDGKWSSANNIVLTLPIYVTKPSLINAFVQSELEIFMKGPVQDEVELRVCSSGARVAIVTRSISIGV